MGAANKIREYLKEHEAALKAAKVYFVCNVKTGIKTPEQELEAIYETEFLSDEEFDQIIHMFNRSKISYKIFQNEKSFMAWSLEKTEPDREAIVYNSAQSGTGAGRKSLIPAFCNLYKMKITGSNPYVVSLCRHKYHVNRLLRAHGIPVPRTWLYDRGWLNDENPPPGQRVILKPIFESASIGIDHDSIGVCRDAILSGLNNLQRKFNQPIAVQEFIWGYEAEVPVICTGSGIISMNPAGISVTEEGLMGEEILDFKRIYYDSYEFYDFSSMPVYSPEMLKTAERAAQILGMNGLCRIDFRLTKEGRYYITDVSTNPHFIRHSSIHFSYLQIGMTETDIIKTVLCSAVNQASLQN